MSTPMKPGSINHQIAGWEFWIEDDGSLVGFPLAFERNDELRLSPADTWALALLFRMPGVRELLNRCELARQHERHVAEEAQQSTNGVEA